MNKLLIAWMCVLLGSPAGWARQAASPDVEDPADAERGRGRAVADVLVCIDIDASPGIFHDLTQRYVDAFAAAGPTTIATAATEVPGGSINFPPDLTAENYPVVVVLGSDNFVQGPNNIDANDETALAAYLDTGGSLLLVGQDYMHGRVPTGTRRTPATVSRATIWGSTSAVRTSTSRPPDRSGTTSTSGRPRQRSRAGRPGSSWGWLSS